MFTLGLWLIVLGLIGLILVDCFAFVSSVHYGVLEFLKRQERGAVKEGLVLKWPFLERLKQIHVRPRTANILVTFTTKNNLKLRLKGTLQYKADPRVMDENGRNVFFRQSEDSIQKGLEADLKAKLGGLGGKYDGERFIQDRIALGDYINQHLRTLKPLHLRQDPPVPAEGILDFYNGQWEASQEELAHEKELADEGSQLEKRYGIDIIAFAIEDIDFTEETARALEDQKQAELRAAIVTKLVEAGGTLRKAFPNASDGQLADMAESIVNNRERNITSVSGLEKGAVPLLNLQNKS